MNIHGLQGHVSSSSLRDILRLERSLQHLAKKKKPNLIWQLHILFQPFRCSLSSLAVVFFLRPFLWSILAFLICGNCLQTLQNVLQQMGNRITVLGSVKHPTHIGWRKTYSCRISTPVPWARLHLTISPSLKRKSICYSFILYKLVDHFTMVTLQKHHYTNNPTTKNTFIIAHVAILMAREGTLLTPLQSIKD